MLDNYRLNSDRERLTELLSRCHDDPDLFNSAILGRPPLWEGQRRIAQSVVDYRVTVAYTGNAVGKDYLVGDLAPWWLYTRDRSLVIITGPSQTVLGSVTWKEIRRACEESQFPLGLKLTNGIKASPLRAVVRGDWGALGYSTTSVERASGQHNRKLFVIVDEASGVEDEIRDAIESLKYVRLLLIGNPIRPTGWFVDLIRQAKKDRDAGIPRHKAVNAIHIPSTASPHAHLDESPVGLADKTWLDACYRHYGKDSLWVKSHIDAIIPEVSTERLLPGEWLDRAAATARPPLRPFDPLVSSRRIAVDLGEGVGRDASSILVRDRAGVLECISGGGVGLAEAARIVFEQSIRWTVEHGRISYDRAGIGRDFGGYLAKHGILEAVGYFGSGEPQNKRAYTNLRTEAAWKLRRRLNPEWSTDLHCPLASQQPPFHIPARDWWPTMRQELEMLTYDLVGNQTRLIPKKLLLEQLGRSPDRSDALIQSFAFDD